MLDIIIFSDLNKENGSEFKAVCATVNYLKNPYYKCSCDEGLKCQTVTDFLHKSNYTTCLMSLYVCKNRDKNKMTDSCYNQIKYYLK